MLSWRRFVPSNRCAAFCAAWTRTSNAIRTDCERVQYCGPIRVARILPLPSNDSPSRHLPKGHWAVMHIDQSIAATYTLDDGILSPDHARTGQTEWAGVH